MTRTGITVLVVGVAAVALAFGGYRVGRAILHVGRNYNHAASQTPQGTRTSASPQHHRRHLDVELALFGLAGVGVLSIVVSVVGAMGNRRRRTRLLL